MRVMTLARASTIAHMHVCIHMPTLTNIRMR
jgi:hypothetical protein